MTLKDARINAGYTLARLAEKVGVSAAALQRYEVGKRTPNAETAKRIADLLGIPWYVIVDNKR